MVSIVTVGVPISKSISGREKSGRPGILGSLGKENGIDGGKGIEGKEKLGSDGNDGKGGREKLIGGRSKLGRPGILGNFGSANGKDGGKGIGGSNGKGMRTGTLKITLSPILPVVVTTSVGIRPNYLSSSHKHLKMKLQGLR